MNKTKCELQNRQIQKQNLTVIILGYATVQDCVILTKCCRSEEEKRRREKRIEEKVNEDDVVYYPVTSGLY